MNDSKHLVLDANILLQAVFGVRVLNLLEKHEDSVDFYAPDVCFDDAHRYIPIISANGISTPPQELQCSIGYRVSWKPLIEVCTRNLSRLHGKGCSLAMRQIGRSWRLRYFWNAPIWTEDQDFFGRGVSTWITASVELYLRGQ